jgi:hypothetical protein
MGTGTAGEGLAKRGAWIRKWGRSLPAWLLGRVPTGARGRALGGLTSAIFLGQIVAPFVYDPLVRVFGSGDTFLSVGVASLLIVLSVRALSGRALATSG